MRRLWFNEDDGNVYIELSDGVAMNDIKLREYLSKYVPDEVDALCKLVLKH